MSNTVKVRPDVYGELANRLDAKRLKRNEPLAQYTTFKIGGPADYFYDATSTDDLAVAVNTARDLDIKFFVLGLGANILVGDKGFRCLVVRLTSRLVVQPTTSTMPHRQMIWQWQSTPPGTSTSSSLSWGWVQTFWLETKDFAAL